MSLAEAPAPRRLLTVPEVAAELRVSERTVRALLARGAIPSITIGRRRLVKREAVDQVIAAGVVTMESVQ